MMNQKIPEIISLAILSSPIASISAREEKISLPPFVSERTSIRRMQYLLASAPRLEIPQIPDSAIAQFPYCGVLKEDDNGFVYLDVDDDYIHELIHFIDSEGFEEPPYFGKPELVGAHISVIYAADAREMNIEECGRVFHFTPLECKIVQPPNWSDIESVYLIEVDGPELDLLRAKYGLPKNEFGFHITIGVKPKRG